MDPKLLEILTTDPLGILDIPPKKEHQASYHDKWRFHYDEIFHFWKTHKALPQYDVKNFHHSLMITRLQVYLENAEIREVLHTREGFLDIVRAFDESQGQETFAAAVRTPSVRISLDILQKKDHSERERLDTSYQVDSSTKEKPSVEESTERALETMPSSEEILSLEDVLSHDPLGLLSAETESDIFDLQHVSNPRQRRGATKKRVKCLEFEQFEHLFHDCYYKLHTGQARLLPLRDISSGKRKHQVDSGRFFMLKKSMVYVTHPSSQIQDRVDKRKRFIFDNGTEAHLLMEETFVKQLYSQGYCIVDRVGRIEDQINDVRQLGYIYVLKSLSMDPRIQEMPHLHKIGYTTGRVEDRIRSAHKESTYLMAAVLVAEKIPCYYIDPQKLEMYVHRFFDVARLNIQMKSAQGEILSVNEWFRVPLNVIRQAITYFLEMSITNYIYDAQTMKIQSRKSK